VDGKRFLVVTADDFGIGPATTHGILDLAAQGLVTCSVLLVNSPYAEPAVRAWRQAGRPLELGWHPCLTLDRPLLPAEQVPSLVGPDGRFHPLGRFLRRLLLGRIDSAEAEAELRAQLTRFAELVGHPPTVVNSHHHVQVFSPVGDILTELLARRPPLPYVRRVREPWPVLLRIPGARLKRLVLSVLGRGNAARQEAAGLAGNDWLAGITDPPCVADPEFLARWLRQTPGRVVELTCHPGYLDTTLVGRDCTRDDGQLERRPRERQLLEQANFRQACRRAGFRLVSPTELRGFPCGGLGRVA
jgi:chitin disaccharide deacetylase